VTADPVVLLGLIMAFLRRSTALGKVATDDLWAPVELLERLLRHLGVEVATHASSGLLLSCIAASGNARNRPAPGRYSRCQHGVGPSWCDLCGDEQDEVPPPSWARRPGRQRARYGLVRHDSRRPAGRSR
jgi:hypothetical protein